MATPLAGPDPLPCEECPRELLDQYLASASGHLILETFELDFALRAGVHITLKDISYPEFLRLQLVVEERQRYINECQAEQMRKAHGR